MKSSPPVFDCSRLLPAQPGFPAGEEVNQRIIRPHDECLPEQVVFLSTVGTVQPCQFAEADVPFREERAE